ncbi:GntR family transcriptional regulator [Bacillus sp. FSL W7-1360]
MFDRLQIQIDHESRIPIYDQIELQIKSLIIGGHLPSGCALPSLRELAAQAPCSVITTRRVYQNLEQNGYIETLQGKGTFVKAMSEQEQETQKYMLVNEAVKRAIDIGRRCGYADSAIKEMFVRALR